MRDQGTLRPAARHRRPEVSANNALNTWQVTRIPLLRQAGQIKRTRPRRKPVSPYAIRTVTVTSLHAVHLPQQDTHRQRSPGRPGRPTTQRDNKQMLSAGIGQQMADDEKETVLFVDSAPWSGGAQRSLLSLISGLQATPFRPVVLSADHSPRGLIAACRKQGIPVTGFSARHWSRTVSGAWQYVCDRRRFHQVLARSVQEWHPQLIHLNGPRPALLLPRNSKHLWRTALHVRDVRLPGWLMRHAASGADGIIAVSRFTGCAWGSTVKDVPITVVPNGLEDESSSGPLPRCLWGPQHLKVLLVGDMTAWKRHPLFLETLRTAHLSMPEIRGIVVGRAHDRAARTYLDELQAYARALDVHHLVQFVTDADDAEPWIGASDVLVSVADGEPFGRTIVEALRMGKPVVTTRGGGPEEILSNSSAGTLVAPTAYDIAAGLKHWREEDTRTSIASAARECASEYSIEHMVEGICQVYAKILKRAGVDRGGADGHPRISDGQRPLPKVRESHRRA